MGWAERYNEIGWEGQRDIMGCCEYLILHKFHPLLVAFLVFLGMSNGNF